MMSKLFIPLAQARSGAPPSLSARNVARALSLCTAGSHEKSSSAHADIAFSRARRPQISLAFILCWVFTLPLALLSVMTVRAAITGVTFAITAAFVGLLKVSVELDDPFGDDPNDIDVNGMVDGVLADLRVVLDEIDGDGAAEKAGIPEAETTVLLPAPATETTGLVPRS